MPLPRNIYDLDIEVDGQLLELRRIVLCHGDELRAELEGGKRGMPITAQLSLTSLMLWAACVRLGHFPGSYDAWRNGGLVEYRRVPADELAGAVDPTHEAAPSGPASPSPATSQASTGSTPTSTSA